MNIGILTFNDTLNFGAALQAYALQQTLENFGHNAEIIKYTNKYIENNEKLTSVFSINSIIKKIVMGKGLKNKEISFRAFEDKYMHFGIEMNENVEKVNRYYDRFITGSDQVWNMEITGNDWRFFLDFVDDNKKKISYAPSFGNVEFPTVYYEKAAEILKKFHAVSVREESGRDTIKRICGLEAKVVLDPTLLLSKSDWESRFNCNPIEEKYILVYCPHNKKLVFDFVKKLKRQTGLQVVYLSISPRIQTGVKTLYDSSPDKFVNWIKNAEYVVTGSFHGTAFSVNLEKQFFYEPTGNGSRIDNLVKITGTQDRDLTKTNFQKIDYNKIRPKLEALRKDSLDWLKNTVEN
ncbi:MAG: polysaccharide pyruvyl transferase family protein [Oscillospiraceae bacterium]|nr:polysaccharide pyruvyl transferase family protein [Oscillospiraceae bacterium]